jgi:hypothetical protein
MLKFQGIHLKLPHEFHKFYIIEIEQLYKELSNANNYLEIESFLSVFHRAGGNEMINSLLEYENKTNNQENHDKSFLITNNSEHFIREKYLNRKFINKNELDMKQNYMNDLNRALSMSLNGQCLTTTIYYIFLGASKFHLSLLNNNNHDRNQSIYLLYFQNLNPKKNLFFECDFLGETYQLLIQSLNRTKFKSYLKLNRNFLSIIHLNDLNKQLILDLGSILSVKITINDQNSIDIRTIENPKLNTFNCEFFNFDETQIWLKQILYRILPIKSLPIDLYTFLNELQIKVFGSALYYSNSDHYFEKRMLILMQSLDFQQRNNFYRKLMVVVDAKRSTFEFYDIRKSVWVKLDKESGVLVVEFQGNKHVKIKELNLDLGEDYWYQNIFEFSTLSQTFIEDQYLNRDNCPLLIDKCLSYIEINFLCEARNFYFPESSTSHNHGFSTSDLHDFLKHSTQTLTSSKKAHNIFHKLERDRDYRLIAGDLSIEVLIKVLKMYFKKYFSNIFLSDLGEILDDKELKNFLDSNLKTLHVTFYHILKRLCVHLALVAKYSHFNSIPIEKLNEFYANLTLFKINAKIFKILVDNCERMFDIQTSYFKIQCEIIDKLIELRSNRNKS